MAGHEPTAASLAPHSAEAQRRTYSASPGRTPVHEAATGRCACGHRRRRSGCGVRNSGAVSCRQLTPPRSAAEPPAAAGTIRLSLAAAGSFPPERRAALRRVAANAVRAGRLRFETSRALHQSFWRRVPPCWSPSPRPSAPGGGSTVLPTNSAKRGTQCPLPHGSSLHDAKCSEINLGPDFNHLLRRHSVTPFLVNRVAIQI